MSRQGRSIVARAGQLVGRARWVFLLVGALLGTKTAFAEPSGKAPTAALADSLADDGEAAEGFLRADSFLEFNALKSRVVAAYGNPQSWLGLSLEPRFEVDHLGVFLGPRLHTGPVEITSGAFGAYSIRRSFLPLRDAYTRDDAEQRLRGEHALYLGVSTSLRIEFALGEGVFESRSEVASVFGVPRERRVFVEHLNAIDGGSWLFEQRVVYTHPVMGFSALELGVAGEWVRLDQRKKDVLRAGPRAVLRLSEVLALRSEVLPVFVSPDTLGLAGGRFELGVWYGWWP